MGRSLRHKAWSWPMVRLTRRERPQREFPPKEKGFRYKDDSEPKGKG